MSSAAGVPLPEAAARRRHARYQLTVPFDLTVFRPGSVVCLSGESQDVGESGLRGVISGAALPGERVELTLELPTSPQPLNMRAVVRHQCDLQCGFEFLSLEQHQREQLQQLAADPGLRAGLVNGAELEPGLEAPPRSDLRLCPNCGHEWPEEIPVCLMCGASGQEQEEEDAGEPAAVVAQEPVPSAALVPDPREKKETRKRRSGPLMDSVVAVVFLVTLSIGLWQWMQNPAQAEGDAQPSPVTVELENVFLRPVPASVSQASSTAESRTSGVLSAATSFVSAAVGNPLASVRRSAPRREAAEPVSRTEEPVTRQTAPEPRRAPAQSARLESTPAPSASQERAAAPSSMPLSAPELASPSNPSAEAISSAAPASAAPSGSDLAGMLLQKVLPVYPTAARRQGVQGEVVLKAIIGKDGTIAELRPLQGPQALTAAAMDAVQHWRFRPYELKGKPVEVETDIRVNFQLPNKK